MIKRFTLGIADLPLPIIWLEDQFSRWPELQVIFTDTAAPAIKTMKQYSPILKQSPFLEISILSGKTLSPQPACLQMLSKAIRQVQGTINRLLSKFALLLLTWDSGSPSNKDWMFMLVFLALHTFKIRTGWRLLAGEEKRSRTLQSLWAGWWIVWWLNTVYINSYTSICEFCTWVKFCCNSAPGMGFSATSSGFSLTSLGLIVASLGFSSPSSFSFCARGSCKNTAIITKSFKGVPFPEKSKK